MLTELEVMKSMQPHPHVVRLIGCCTEKGTGFIKTMKRLLAVICLIPNQDIIYSLNEDCRFTEQTR